MSDVLKLGPRVPAGSNAAVGVAFLTVPHPEPGRAVALVDATEGLQEDASPRTVTVVYDGEVGDVLVSRATGGTDPSSAPDGAFTLPGSPGNTLPPAVAVLDDLRWDIPCDAAGNCADPAPKVAVLGGSTGTSYDVTLRFRGVIETKYYVNGTEEGYWYVGGQPDTASGVGNNEYRLDISDPPSVYWLNARSTPTDPVMNVQSVDYTQTLTMAAGATVTLTPLTVDGLEYPGPISDPPPGVPGVVPGPYGQYLQMNVVGLSAVGGSTLSQAVLTPTSQMTATTPLRLLRVEEDVAGSWQPVVSRGLFYRLFTVGSAEGASSWLRSAGFADGQTLLLGYTTELDWRQQAASGRWTGSGQAGGGGLWRARRSVPQSVDPMTLGLLPAGVAAAHESSRLLALGGLTGPDGTEWLAEAGSASAPPGDGNGVLGALLVSLYNARPGDVTQGRIRSGTALDAQVLSVAWGTAVDLGDLLTAFGGLAAGWNGDPSVLAFRFAGAFYCPAEGFYTLTFTHHGKLRVFHWNLPVVDRAYGVPAPGPAAATVSRYTAYLHAGWHDLAVEWAPEQGNTNTALTLTQAGPGALTLASGPTSRSRLAGVDPLRGTLSLHQSLSAADAARCRASYAVSGSGLALRGFFGSSGAWESLDLNPSYGRSVSSGSGAVPETDTPTRRWLNGVCWVWALPTTACALTDAAGTPLTTGLRPWASCAAYGLQTALRWGYVSGQSVLSPTTDPGLALGSGSSFGTAILGGSVYSGDGATVGVTDTVDPRGDYASAAILGRLTVVAGAPSLDAVRAQDVRRRGGGLSHETPPESLPAGGPRERTSTGWDLSAWDGQDLTPAGTVLVEVPEAYLTGSDGGPVWTAPEVQALVEASLPAGIRAVIQYTP